MISGEIPSAIDRLRADVDDLLAASVDELSASELASVLESLEVQRRRLEAVDQRLLASASSPQLASAFAAPGLAEVLTGLLRIDPREARDRVYRSRDLGPRRTLTGEALEPILPAAAAAAARGEVSGAQLDVIVGCLERISPEAPSAAWPVAEKVLVEAAKHEAPKQLRRTAVELLARLDPDGLEPVEDKAERRRALTLVKKADGTSRPTGSLTAEQTAVWEAIFDSLAAPQPTDGIPDERTAAQRRHDALLEVARRVMRSDTLPSAGGVPVTVMATTTMTELSTAAATASQPRELVTPTGGFRLAELAQAAGLDPAVLAAATSSGLALLGHGQLVSARQLLTMACEAKVVPVVFDDAGGVLQFGSKRRYASRGQRLALAARDRGCSFPGCDRPAAWCEVHHVIPWIKDGPTDLENLTLVCAWHHHTFERFGWSVIMRDGLPWWVPPAVVDPERRAVRNTVNHPPDIVFRQPTRAA